MKRQLLAQEEADFKRKLLVHDHGQNKTDAIHGENSKCKAAEKDKYFKENIHKNQRRSADQRLRYAEIVRGSSNKFDYNKTRISLNKKRLNDADLLPCKFCLEKHIWGRANCKAYSEIQSKETDLLPCKYCSEKHVWGRKNCKAYGHRCYKCLRFNHNAKACRNQTENVRKSKTLPVEKRKQRADQKGVNVKVKEEAVDDTEVVAHNASNNKADVITDEETGDVNDEDNFKDIQGLEINAQAEESYEEVKDVLEVIANGGNQDKKKKKKRRRKKVLQEEVTEDKEITAVSGLEEGTMTKLEEEIIAAMAEESDNSDDSENSEVNSDEEVELRKICNRYFSLGEKYEDYNPKVLKEIYGFELKLAKRVRKVKEDEGFQGK